MLATPREGGWFWILFFNLKAHVHLGFVRPLNFFPNFDWKTKGVLALMPIQAPFR